MEVVMRVVKNSERLKDILVSTRNQIVALQDIKMDMLSRNNVVAENIQQQILALEEVYKHQLILVNLTIDAEPKKKNWWLKEDRLSNVLD
jgi:uncharacterized protein related to proFAR isomerase